MAGGTPARRRARPARSRSGAPPPPPPPSPAHRPRAAVAALRPAGCDVWAGASARAVLVELGFLDHPLEGAQLLDSAHQRRLAQALAAAVDDFAHGATRVARADRSSAPRQRGTGR